MQDLKCVFCEQYKNGCLVIGKRRIKDYILHETPNFLVFPSVGPLVEGHLLIVPKKHCYSIAGLPPDFYEELEALVKSVGQLLTKEYCKPIFFEHGTVSSLANGGTSIDHAHLHALPLNLGLTQILNKKFAKKEIVFLKELKKFFKDEKPYLFFQTPSGQRFCYEVQGRLESQYLRKIIAENIGRSRYWNWRYYPRTKCFLKTLKQLRSANFKKYDY